jgi:hypothetical protein
VKGVRGSVVGQRVPRDGRIGHGRGQEARTSGFGIIASVTWWSSS